MTVTNLREFLSFAHGETEAEDIQAIMVVGKISKHLEVDGRVVERVGVVDGSPAYSIRCSLFSTSNGNLAISDSHEDWLNAGNSESQKISREDLELVVVCNVSNPDFSPDYEHVLMYPNARE